MKKPAKKASAKKATSRAVKPKKSPVIQVEDARGLSGTATLSGAPVRIKMTGKKIANLGKPDLAEKVQALIDGVAQVPPVEGLITSAVAKALKNRFEYHERMMRAEIEKRFGRIDSRIEEFFVAAQRASNTLHHVDAVLSTMLMERNAAKDAVAAAAEENIGVKMAKYAPELLKDIASASNAFVESKESAVNTIATGEAKNRKHAVVVEVSGDTKAMADEVSRKIRIAEMHMEPQNGVPACAASALDDLLTKN